MSIDMIIQSTSIESFNKIKAQNLFTEFMNLNFCLYNKKKKLQWQLITSIKIEININ